MEKERAGQKGTTEIEKDIKKELKRKTQGVSNEENITEEGDLKRRRLRKKKELKERKLFKKRQKGEM